MPVLSLGISYRRAPVELLERLSFPVEDEPKAYRHLRDMEAVREGVILSTCNRVEVFAEVASYHAGFLDLKRFLSESREIGPDEFAEPMYAHYEEDAVRHLFSVAGGIDSMVLGEPQILSQVREAYRRAEAEEAMGPITSALFRGAIRAGRRVRTETAIGSSPGAMVETGMALAEEALRGLADRTAVVVGAGGMASLAASSLRAHRVGALRILNRSVARAQKLAGRAGAEAEGLDGLARALTHADLVVFSTGAAGTVLGPAPIARAMTERRPRDRPLFLLDLAVPRDVDPGVVDIAGVTLADIDDLKEQLDGARGEAGAEVERARGIVAEEARRFSAWRRAFHLAPLIQGLRQRGERVLAAELQRAAPRLADLSDREREAVEVMARGIVAKLLHDPIVRLKNARSPGGDQLARDAAELFGIDFRPEP
jgi:glutamyl-tRNA reductase